MFTDIVPFLVYLSLPILEMLILERNLSRLAAAGTTLLIGLSVSLAVPGALTHSALCWSATPKFVNDAPERVWDWKDPQFLRPINRLRAGDSLHTVVLGSCTAPAATK